MATTNKACVALVQIHQRRLESCWRELGLKRFPKLGLRSGQDLMTGYFAPDENTIMINILPPLSVAVYRSSSPAASLHRSIVATLAHETRHAWQMERFGRSYLVRLKNRYRYCCEAVWAMVAVDIGLLVSLVTRNSILGITLALLIFFLGWALVIDLSRLLYQQFGYDRDVVERDAKAFEQAALGRDDWLSVVSVEVCILNHLTTSRMKLVISDD